MLTSNTYSRNDVVIAAISPDQKSLLEVYVDSNPQVLLCIGPNLAVAVPLGRKKRCGNCLKSFQMAMRVSRS